MFKFLMIMLASVLAIGASAQSSLSGLVRDSKSHQPLAGASVQLASQSAVTDEQGRFEFKNLKPGDYALTVSFVGYQTDERHVVVQDQTSVEVDLLAVTQLTDEVVVYATRASEKSPTAFSNISGTVIQKQNFGQDMPFVLNWTPSLVTTSDAGAGIGYTGVRIRGSDATRINVTINGIVLNDAEEQGVYWVDVPDIATSTQNIQIQRGVGTSTNGAGAFGASINLQTNTRKDAPYADILNSFGSFGTHRHTVGFGTGLQNKFAFDGRLSLIGSDGYIDRASSDLKSYYLAGGYYGDKTMIKAIVFGGKEITYQSWYGVPESMLSTHRTYNYYTYKNQIDNYAQDHYQLHIAHQVNSHLNANAALHYTYGRGYYEEYQPGQLLSQYGVTPPVINGKTMDTTDLVRRLWLDNRFYGMTWSLNYEKENWASTLGGAYNRYDGDHYGEIVWAQVALTLPPFYRYYFNRGQKQDFNIFWKNNLILAEKWLAYADLQYRHVDYQAQGTEDGLQPVAIQVNYNFFNPKLGLTYTLKNDQQVYASLAVGNREPVRSDFIQANPGQQPLHETLQDVEAGWRFRNGRAALNVNGYYMRYYDQLVLTGQLNNVGAPVRTSVPNSYRAGIEFDGGVKINNHVTWNANLTLSRNRIKQFTEVLYDETGASHDVAHTDVDIAYSPSVIAGSVFLYRPVAPLEIGWLVKYVGMQYLDNTSNRARSIDPYFINDFRLTLTTKPKGMREFSVSLLLNNVLDVKYSSNGATYPYLYGGQVYADNYYYPQATRNYLLMVAMRF